MLGCIRFHPKSNKFFSDVSDSALSSVLIIIHSSIHSFVDIYCLLWLFQISEAVSSLTNENFGRKLNTDSGALY